MRQEQNKKNKSSITYLVCVTRIDRKIIPMAYWGAQSDMGIDCHGVGFVLFTDPQLFHLGCGIYSLRMAVNMGFPPRLFLFAVLIGGSQELFANSSSVRFSGKYKFGQRCQPDVIARRFMAMPDHHFE
jgi:hypothetical protein